MKQGEEMIVINSLSADAMIYGAKGPRVEMSQQISSRINLAVLAACCSPDSHV